MKLLEVGMVMLYNLALVAGASYLYVVHDVTGWIFLLPLIFAASWNTKENSKESKE